MKIVMPAYRSCAAHGDVETSSPADLPKISGDATQLTQVFINILTNALQASCPAAANSPSPSTRPRWCATITRTCAPASLRYTGSRVLSRAQSPPFRSVFHHQRCGCRNRSGIVRELRYRAGARRKPSKWTASWARAPILRYCCRFHPRRTVKHSILVVDDEAAAREGLELTLSGEGYSVSPGGPCQRGPDPAPPRTDGPGHPPICECPARGGDELLGPGAQGVARPRGHHRDRLRHPGFRHCHHEAGGVRLPDETLQSGERPPGRPPGPGQKAPAHREYGTQAPALALSGWSGTNGRRIGASSRAVFTLIRQVAPSTANVLITGESGTGKELVSCAIHYSSVRAGKPFVGFSLVRRSYPRIPSRSGAVRLREGRLHRCPRAAHRPDRVGQWRYDLSGRDRRDFASGAGQALASLARSPGDAGRLHTTRPGRFSPRDRHQQRSGRGDFRRQFSVGSLLPAQCYQHQATQSPASAAATSRSLATHFFRRFRAL